MARQSCTKIVLYDLALEHTNDTIHPAAKCLPHISSYLMRINVKYTHMHSLMFINAKQALGWLFNVLVAYKNFPATVKY